MKRKVLFAVGITSLLILTGCSKEDTSSSEDVVSGFKYNSCTINCSSPASWDGRCYNVQEDTVDKAVDECETRVRGASTVLNFYQVTLTANRGTCE